MDAIDPSEFELKTLKERGFVRKKCKVCGTYFWTKDPKRETCGEAPCDPYTFMGGKKFNRSMNVRETRQYFLKFFADRGHTVIAPRPVVARWRDDLYLTSASIVLFQPYVTTGLIPPPANPLVVSQPCIRFVDVDRVGLTAGRHLTIFEMGGAHAFNRQGDWKYWKDETVAYGLDFLESLGVSEDEITLKEDFWEGGGNAGPAFEVIYGGLELETLVFMKFVESNGKYVEMPMKIVDTGYGIERFSWVSQGTPTAFEAIFPNLIRVFADKAGLTLPPSETLTRMTQASIYGLGDPSVADSLMAKAMGLSSEEYARQIKPYQYLGGLLDHTKTIAFLLSDGVIPSNAGEGYLARLILRRALRLKMLLSMEVPLEELVALQIKEWSPDFPNLVKEQDRVLELVSMEEQKYDDALKKGLGVLERKIASIGTVNEDTLMKLYDSYGVPIELITKALSEKGVQVSVPADFYSRLAAIHASAPKGRLGEKTKRTVPHEDAFAGMAETRPLYYERDDPEFSCRVERYERFPDGEFIVLDQTAFYPEGGGQPSDTGELVWDGGKARVIRVYKTSSGTIVHEVTVSGIPPAPGASAKGLVDWERRKQLMRGHTGTHLLLAAARRVLGDHVWQMGAQKGEEINRLDLLHYKPISREQINEIERLANGWIMDNIVVEKLELERDIAETAYGYQIYQGGVVPGKRLRIVRIDDVDAEACGGTHVKRTGDIGLLKVRSVNRIQESVFRFEFSVGFAALKYVQDNEEALSRAAQMVEGNTESLFEKLGKLTEELHNDREQIKSLKSSLAREYASGAEEISVRGFKAKLIRLKDDLEPRDVAVEATSASEVAIVLSSDRRKVALAARLGGPASVDFALGPLRKAGGRGGGSAKLLEFVFEKPVDDELLRSIVES